jgi:hypothetical protein
MGLEVGGKNPEVRGRRSENERQNIISNCELRPPASQARLPLRGTSGQARALRAGGGQEFRI